MIIIASYSNVSVTYTADGTQTVFSFPFDYLRKAFVFVEADGTALEQGTDFSVYEKTVVFTTTPTAGTKLRIYRETDTIPLVSWADASVLKAKDMTIQQVQVLHILEEYKGQYNEDLANMLIIAGVVTDSEELQHIVDQLNLIDSNVTVATESATASANSAIESAQSATNSENSASDADATVAALIEFLRTKETLTAPAVDPLLTISGAAADAKVTGENINGLNKQIQSLHAVAVSGGTNASTGGTILGLSVEVNGCAVKINGTVSGSGSTRVVSIQNNPVKVYTNFSQFATGCTVTNTLIGGHTYRLHAVLVSGTYTTSEGTFYAPFAFPDLRAKIYSYANGQQGNALFGGDGTEYTPQNDETVGALAFAFISGQVFNNAVIVAYIEDVTVTSKLNTIDKTLSVDGLPADAKVTGENISGLNELHGVAICGNTNITGNPYGVDTTVYGCVVKLNGTFSGDNSNSRVVSLQEDIVRGYTSSTIDDCTLSNTLLGGHTYRLHAVLVSGTYTAGSTTYHAGYRFNSTNQRITLHQFVDGHNIYDGYAYFDGTEFTPETDTVVGALTLCFVGGRTFNDAVIIAYVEDVSLTFDGNVQLETIEQIEVPESYATITGDDGTTYTASGITFTKISDNKFTLTGNSSLTARKIFNVLLGSNQVLARTDNIDLNITEPGVYTLAYKTSGASVSPVFGIVVDGTKTVTRYLKSGESFNVGDEDVALFAYAPSKLKLNGKTLVVKWALYKGEEYVGYPYMEGETGYTAIDVVARNKASNRNNESTTTAYLSWGQANIMANARQVVQIPWSPVAATMPSGKNTYYDPNVVYKGLPYSSVRGDDKAIGTNVSIHTFMTAVHDPNSVLYTRRSNVSNANTYYGTVCSGLCNYAYGIGLNLTNFFLGESDWFEDIPMQAIQIGDMIYKPGHVAMIYDIKQDEYGRIVEVTVMEEWAPTPRFRHYSTWDSFISSRPGYIARRFKGIYGVGYTQIPYIRCFDEDAVDVIYPNVQTEFGDAAVVAIGEDVKINVIDASDYTVIDVLRDGTLVQTRTSITPFTISNVQPGLYTIRAYGGDNESVSTFFVADVHGTYDTASGVVTFSSSNATPVLVNVYNLPIDEDGRYALSCKPIPLNDEDRERGSVNALEIIGESYDYAKVTFNTPYGQVDWRSENTQFWVEIE